MGFVEQRLVYSSRITFPVPMCNVAMNDPCPVCCVLQHRAPLSMQPGQEGTSWAIEGPKNLPVESRCGTACGLRNCPPAKMQGAGGGGGEKEEEEEKGEEEEEEALPCVRQDGDCSTKPTHTPRETPLHPGDHFGTPSAEDAAGQRARWRPVPNLAANSRKAAIIFLSNLSASSLTRCAQCLLQCPAGCSIHNGVDSQRSHAFDAPGAITSHFCSALTLSALSQHFQLLNFTPL